MQPHGMTNETAGTEETEEQDGEGAQVKQREVPNHAGDADNGYATSA